ncbi:MAG: peptidoglycan-binding domain-containing protein [Eubacteriales bacterium]|nr:peptidoglycan-binding domain-containing protein [Eubacteriales bacterium]
MAINHKGAGSFLRKGLSLLLTVCTVFIYAPSVLADSVGSTPSSVTDSATKSFIKLNDEITLFSTSIPGESGGITVSSGTVLMLVSQNTYTTENSEGETEEYGCLYYNNTRYNVVWSDVVDDILTDAQMETYITGTLWKVTAYASLKRDLNLTGSVQVYGLQMALKTLGYYSSSLDGEYGEYTERAVKAFQAAYRLTADGDAGPITQKVLYPLALAAAGGSGSSSSSSIGTLTTTVNLNFRKTASTKSVRLAVVPAKTSLSYTATSVVSGVTWYYTTYNGLNGWLMGTYVTTSGSSSSGGSSSIGTLKTTVNLNLRKSYSTKSVRLVVVPKSTTLSYTKTTTSGGVTWYYVTYNSINGWLMGTYVSASGSSGSSGSSTSTGLGTVTITKANTRVRTSANGSKSGYVLAKGTTTTLLATPTTAGGYTWYHIKTSSGITGYVRGDCASVSYDASSGVTPSTTKTYVKLTSDVTLFTSDEKSSTGAVTVSSGTVLQMVSSETYTKNNVKYCSLYYNNNKYNCVYADVSGGIMSTSALTTYITETLWPKGYVKTLKADLNLTGDIYVHSLQYALTILGYYTGAMDGNFGSGTTSGVRNFQRKYNLTVDGSAGPETSAVLYAKAIAAITGTSGSDTSDFGAITDITMTSWDFGNAGADIFPKSATATIMDVDTQMVFKVKRWAGAYHADCVPLTASDTKTMCDIVSFTYNGSPSSSQISQIKNYSINGGTAYTWPDFNGKLTGVSSIGSNWDRRAALLNYNGHVYCVSIYGWPHGYGEYSTCDAFASTNNYYGMMCIHFKGSYTHVNGTVDDKHQAAIQKAYSFAKTKWPSLCK